jgi:hypothetical protein
MEIIICNWQVGCFTTAEFSVALPDLTVTDKNTAEIFLECKVDFYLLSEEK